MNCINCGEKFSFLAAFKFWLTVNRPSWLDNRLEKRKVNADLNRLIKLYTTSANLTPREHFVCSARVRGQAISDIANNMVVTRERVSQIQAKALRKLERAKC